MEKEYSVTIGGTQLVFRTGKVAKQANGAVMASHGKTVTLQRLKDAAEKAKKELSSTMTSNVNLPFITAVAGNPVHLNMDITAMEDSVFVKNDTYMNRKDMSLLLITDPNMSGKSTYIRQTALIVLLAQAGCFVRRQIGRASCRERV